METKQKLHRLYNALLKVDKVFVESMDREVDIPALNPQQCDVIITELINTAESDTTMDVGEKIDIVGSTLAIEINQKNGETYIRQPLIKGTSRENLKQLYVDLLIK